MGGVEDLCRGSTELSKAMYSSAFFSYKEREHLLAYNTEKRIRGERAYVASTDKISSSAHQSGESLGTAWFGVIGITCFSFSVTSFIVGLFLESCCVQSLITSQITSNSSFL